MYKRVLTRYHPQTNNPPRPYAQAAYSMPNGAPGAAATVPHPGAAPLLPNQGRVIQQGSIRVLCIADVRGAMISFTIGL